MHRNKPSSPFPECQANATWGCCDESAGQASHVLGLHHSLIQRLSLLQASPRRPSCDGFENFLRAQQRASLARSRSLRRTAHDFEHSYSPKFKRQMLENSKLVTLLSSLRTEEFVGKLDPQYHSHYLSAPNDMEFSSSRGKRTRSVPAAMSLLVRHEGASKTSFSKSMAAVKQKAQVSKATL
jgi:hypothetical protein